LLGFNEGRKFLRSRVGEVWGSRLLCVINRNLFNQSNACLNGKAPARDGHQTQGYRWNLGRAAG
jgi:hypothetical protein